MLVGRRFHVRRHLLDSAAQNAFDAHSGQRD